MRRHPGFRTAALLAMAWLAASCRERPAQAIDPPLEESLSATRELKAGDPAPDFELPGSDGKVYRLSAYKGRQPVVLAWFAKAFTDG